MRKIKMNYQGKVLEFTITYECKEYIFCECAAEPSARGFFTTKYVTNNKQ